jgi:glutaredoxin-like protein NrdH
MVKEFLSQRGVAFEERDVSVNPAYAQELVNSTGQMGVPVTVINGLAIIGFDRPRLEQVLSQEQRPSLGIAVADAGKIAINRGTDVAIGAYVGKVRQGSLGDKMGLLTGDIIVEVNRQNVANAGDLEQVISGLGGGSLISIVFIRGNIRHSAEGKL